jgi:F-type H+-transporting ATPase subunit gamma
MSLKSVKTKIKSIDKTRQVTKAMEAVSAVKMRKSQQYALSARPYALAALKILRAASASADAKGHPFLQGNASTRTLMIVVSADKGLAGSYGSALLKRAYTYMRDENLTRENIDLITIGRKATEHFQKRKYAILAHRERWGDQITFNHIRPIAQEASKRYTEGAVGKVVIVYTNFLSTLRQEAVVRELLPLSVASISEVIRGIVPEHGRFATMNADIEETLVRDVTFEPSADAILEELLTALFDIEIYHTILEANASEHSARMIAMKNASDNAREISRSLKLTFNKVRQSSITKEVSEIVGGMESMKVVD